MLEINMCKLHLHAFIYYYYIYGWLESSNKNLLHSKMQFLTLLCQECLKTSLKLWSMYAN